MSKKDEESGYDLGDLAAGALIGAAVAAIGVTTVFTRALEEAARRNRARLIADMSRAGWEPETEEA